MWNEPLPEGLSFDGQVRLSVEADVLPDGSFGRELLVVAGDAVHVVTLDGDAAPCVRLEVPFKELAEPKAESFVGGGALEALRDDTRIELVRYTAAASPASRPQPGCWASGSRARMRRCRPTRSAAARAAGSRWRRARGCAPRARRRAARSSAWSPT